MTLTGRQKAAMLLMSLDVPTATEILRGFDADVVQELAVELSYLDAAGFRDSQQGNAITQEFCELLQKKPEFEMKSFLDEILKNTLGKERAVQVQSDLNGLLKKKDPFLAARMADKQTLVSILDGEHPQAVAVVLSELPPKQSSEVLGQLGEGIRLSAISRMTNVDNATPEARACIADMITQKLEATQSAQSGSTGEMVKASPEQSLRKVAIVLRNLDTEIQNSVLTAVGEKDSQTADSMRALMVVWEDIPLVEDRSMQQGLRGIDEQTLALALYGADSKIANKIKNNISERASAMVDEETALMSSPKKKEIEEARDKITNALRELNGKGELTFEE
jgi:flagellar motor switch protein FliG